MEMPRVGTDFAGYQVQGILGRGGMSVVYQAEHPRLARVVALKVLALELAEDDRFRERFVRESRLAASLDHPNIIPIYDAGASEGLLFIAMRFVKGDLKSVMQREGRLRPERLMPVITQVASALDAAHHLGLVHRDVKPANVLIASGSGADGQDHVYLADFGLTKHAASRSGITGTGQFVGTVDYMAPEQIEGKQVDGRVDVYALGCIVYESLTGRVPFTRDTDAAVIWAHLKEVPPKLSAVAPNLPAEVDDVIAKAMSKSADDRYDGCMAFLAALREATTLDPARSQRGSVTAPPPSRETVFRERRGDVPGQSAGQQSPLSPPAASAAPPSFAPPPPSTGPPASSASEAPVEPSRHDGRSEVPPATAEPMRPESEPAARSAAPIDAPAEREPAVSPGEDKRRGRLTGLVALVVALLVGAGILAWLFRDDIGVGTGSGEAAGGVVTAGDLVARTTSDLSPVGAFPDTVESLFLVAHVGADNIVQWNCRRELSLEDAIRGLSCSPGDGVSEVKFSLFHDGFRLRSHFGNLSRSALSGPGTECFVSDSWRGSWSIGPETWAHAIGRDHGQYGGRAYCFKDSTGQPHIAWIDYATKIFAEASTPAGGEDALYSWWRQEAGPGHPTHIHSIESGNTAAVEGQNVVTGAVLAVGRDSANNITSATLKASDGKETEVYFDDRTYDCDLVHLLEHKDTPITVPVERIEGRRVVTYFTHC